MIYLFDMGRAAKVITIHPEIKINTAKSFYSIYCDEEQKDQNIFKGKLKTEALLFLGSFINRFLKFIAFKNFLKKLCKKWKPASTIAVSEPFMLFKRAFKLLKKFQTPWIANYRDNWSNDITFLTSGCCYRCFLYSSFQHSVLSIKAQKRKIKI